MLKEYYTVGEVAKILEIPPKALRNYDSLDLLKPSFTDPKTKYRYYTYDQFFMIDVIKYLNKVLFIPLEEIKCIFSNTDNDVEQQKLFLKHKKYLQEQILKQKYALQLIGNLLESPHDSISDSSEHAPYESYYLDRALYYHPLDIPLTEIDCFVNRSDLSFINHDNIESDNMCLLFSLSDYKKRGALFVKGFGIFSDKPVDGLNCKIIREGRYTSQRFIFSETKCLDVFSTLLNHNIKNCFSVSDTFILVSKTVDFKARDKYKYPMTMQMLCKCNERRP